MRRSDPAASLIAELERKLIRERTSERPQARYGCRCQIRLQAELSGYQRAEAIKRRAAGQNALFLACEKKEAVIRGWRPH